MLEHGRSHFDRGHYSLWSKMALQGHRWGPIYANFWFIVTLLVLHAWYSLFNLRWEMTFFSTIEDKGHVPSYNKQTIIVPSVKMTISLNGVISNETIYDACIWHGCVASHALRNKLLSLMTVIKHYMSSHFTMNHTRHL